MRAHFPHNCSHTRGNNVDKKANRDRDLRDADSEVSMPSMTAAARPMHACLLDLFRIARVKPDGLGKKFMGGSWILNPTAPSSEDSRLLICFFFFKLRMVFFILELSDL